METCDIIVILSFLDFRWNHLATTNYGAQKFQQSVHIPLFCWSLVRLNLNHSHGCFASGGGEAYTSGQGSYLGKRGKPPYQLYHYYLFPFVYYSRTQHNLNEMKWNVGAACHSVALMFFGLCQEVFISSTCLSVLMCHQLPFIKCTKKFVPGNSYTNTVLPL